MRENNNKPLFRKVDCIRIPVTDLQDGLKFYRDELGHELVWRNSDKGAGLKLANDESEIVLYTEQKGLEIDFTVDNVADAVKQFVDAGGTIVYGPFDIRIGKCAVVKDPWDNQYILLDTSKGLLKTDSDKNVINSISD